MATPHRRYGNIASSSQQRAASPRYMAYSNEDSLTGFHDVSEGRVSEVTLYEDLILLTSTLRQHLSMVSLSCYGASSCQLKAVQGFPIPHIRDILQQ